MDLRASQPTDHRASYMRPLPYLRPLPVTRQRARRSAESVGPVLITIAPAGVSRNCVPAPVIVIGPRLVAIELST